MFNLKIFTRPFVVLYLLTKLLFLLFFYFQEDKFKNIKFFRIKKYTDKIEFKIRILLENLGPIFIKLGQILSTRSDFIPDIFINEFKKLRTNVKPVDFKIVKNIIKDQFGEKHNFIFSKINENPIASASIAQIHSAVLNNKEKVIIKILKPNIKHVILIDIFLLRIIAYILYNFFTKFDRLKPLDLVDELKVMLENEINFNYEASNLLKIKKNFNNNKSIYIPKLHLEFLRNNIFVMEYVDGITITNKDKLFLKGFDLNLLTKLLVNVFYLQAFKHRFFHADLHPGNIFISKNNFNEPVIIFIDFGIISILKKNEVLYLAENILAFTKKDYRKIAILHLNSGTISTNKTIYEIENDIFSVFEPIFNKKIKDIDFKSSISSVMNLGSKFNLQIQPQMILFQKNLLIIESLCRDLSPDCNIWNLTRVSLENSIVGNIFLEKFLSESRFYLKKLNDDFINNNVTKINNNKIDSKKKENKTFIRKFISNFNFLGIFFSDIVGGIVIGYTIGVYYFMYLIQDLLELIKQF